MEKIEQKLLLWSDKPLTDPNEDRLGYAPFAKHLAQSINNMIPREGLVVAIHGEWGSGKSTVINFIIHYLHLIGRKERPIIVPFNPWWFSGQEALIRHFFSQLQLKFCNWKPWELWLKIQLSNLADLVAKAPSPYSHPLKILNGLLKMFISKHQDINEIKASISRSLLKQRRRIVIILDDIDRLTNEEIRQLFLVMKAVADFPNVTYLLSFDKKIVSNSLCLFQGISGDEYLEKIIQVSFNLPLPDKTSLRKMFFEKLIQILAPTPDELFDRTALGNVFYDGIDHLINSPRDVMRLINALTVSYPAVVGEVNPVDFIAIEALRVFCPFVYDIVSRNQDMFSGSMDSSLRSSIDEVKAFHNSWIDNNKIGEKDREPLIKLLKRIFPKLESVWGNSNYNSTWESTWRKKLLICSADKFSIYFRLSLPEGGISNTELLALIKLTDDQMDFSDKLLALSSQHRPDGTTRLRAFLESLEDYTKNEIPEHNIPSILGSFFDIGDALLKPEDDAGMYTFGTDLCIGRLTRQLLKRFKEEKARYEVLKRVIQNGNALSTIKREVTTLGQQHGKYNNKPTDPEKELIVNLEHLNELENIAVEKIRNAAREGTLLHTPNLNGILYRWRDWGSKDEAKKWVSEVISTDKGLAKLLEEFLSKVRSHAFEDRVVTISYRLNPKWLSDFLDPSEIIERAKSLAGKEGLPEKQLIAVKQFVLEYDLITQGKNPDHPFNQEE